MARRHRLPAVAHADAPAAPPGTLRVPPNAQPSRLEAMAWGPDDLESLESRTPAEAVGLRDRFPVTWLNMIGLADLPLLEELAQRLDLHRLALEDTLNIPQRPKVEDYGSHYYFVARMPVSKTALQTEQLSFFLGRGYVFTVQERPGDCFQGIRNRIREGRPRIRSGGTDYLVYAIIDSLVDAYLPVIESIAEELDDIELVVIHHADSEQITRLHDLKRDLVTLRRYLEPLREMIELCIAEETEILEDQTRIYMRDCLDHCSHAIDLVESHRAHANNIMDLHLSVAGQRMNEVMKVLTVIATLFIPLSFIAGLYGMNFDTTSRWNLPELGWTFGYPYALGLMVLCAGAMLVYFWRKGWFR